MSEWKWTDIGRVPADWELKSLDEIKSIDKKSIISGPFGSNISAKYFVGSGIPVIRGNNLSLDINIKFKDSGFVYVSENKAQELATWALKDDIIFTSVGTIGQVGILLGNEKFERYIISNKQLRLRVNKELVEPLYAYYWFASPLMIDMIIQRNTGSSVPLINLSVLKSLLIPLPSKNERTIILGILSSLDDKIDLLHRQNQTLEKMAETLFRQWFLPNRQAGVEETKEDWEEKKLGDFISIKHGFAFKGNCISSEPTNLILVTPGNFKIGGGFKSDKFKYYSNEDFPKEYVFKTGELIVTMTDLSVDGNTLGYPALIPMNNLPEIYLHNQRVGKVLFKKEIGKYFLYNLMKTEDYQWFILSGASGTAIRHTSPTSICNYSFKLPPITTLKEFENIVSPFMYKFESNNNQIRTLEKLRDTLLPKLMSGEVRVEI